MAKPKTAKKKPAAKKKGGAPTAVKDRFGSLFRKKPAAPPPKKTRASAAPAELPAERMSLDRKLDIAGVVAALIGILTLLSLLSPNRSGLTNAWVNLWRGVFGWGVYVFPLALILILVMVFHLALSVSMGIVILCLLVVLRYSFKKSLESLKEGFSWELLVIILGVMTFKAVLNHSGAVDNISTFFSENEIPVLPVLFLLPFISGLLTGLTIGFVGATFPLITGLDGAQNIWAISFAFASGYVGVLLSPVHLCLVLTREYFKANMTGIYQRIIKASILILLAAITEYFLLN